MIFGIAAILDSDEPGQMAAEAMSRFGAHKNRHYFQLERPNYRDKSGESWPVEIEDLLPWPLPEAFIAEYPEAVAERFQRGDIHKVVILGKPVKQDGQVFDNKMMLTEFVRQRANVADLAGFIDLLAKARKCMTLKQAPDLERCGWAKTLRRGQPHSSGDSPNLESSGIASPTS